MSKLGKKKPNGPKDNILSQLSGPVVLLNKWDELPERRKYDLQNNFLTHWDPYS